MTRIVIHVENVECGGHGLLGISQVVIERHEDEWEIILVDHMALPHNGDVTIRTLRWIIDEREPGRGSDFRELVITDVIWHGIIWRTEDDRHRGAVGRFGFAVVAR